MIGHEDDVGAVPLAIGGALSPSERTGREQVRTGVEKQAAHSSLASSSLISSSSSSTRLYRFLGSSSPITPLATTLENYLAQVRGIT